MKMESRRAANNQGYQMGNIILQHFCAHSRHRR